MFDSVHVKILTDDQKKRAAGEPIPEEPGQVVPAGVRTRLELTDAQREQVAALQKEAEGRLDRVLDEKQRAQFKAMRDKKPDPPGPGGPPGPQGPAGGGGLFRATRYPADYPGLKGREHCQQHQANGKAGGTHGCLFHQNYGQRIS